MGWEPVGVTRHLMGGVVVAVLLGGCGTGGHVVPPVGVTVAPSSPSTTGSVAPSPTASPTASPVAFTWPVPDDILTPGAVVAGCTYPRPAADRNVSTATKHAAAVEYNYTGHAGIAYVEYDHRIPYALCGADTLPNIWPEPTGGYPQTAYSHNRKDELEAALASKVRYHHMTLEAAQAVFLGDWRAGWCEFVRHPTGFC